MKNKPAVMSVLMLGLFLVGSAYAASGVRGAKAMTTSTQTASGVIIASGPVVLYSVIIGTGAVTDFVTIFDTNTTAALVAASQLTGNFRGRLYPTSATANTNIVFDPPLQFRAGLYAIPATALGTYTFVWEGGRITQGN